MHRDKMPLPNLELKSRQNGGGSYINGGGVQNDPGQTSYREQVRDRLQNTPRGGGGANNNDFKTAKIDLSLFGAASENGGGSSYYRPLSRSNMASQQRRTGGGANINGNGASNNSYANSNRASMSNMKRQIVFYNKTYVPSSSDGNNNNDAADDNNDVVTTSNHNHQRRTSHRLSVNNDANENELLSTSTRLNNSRDFYSKNNDDYFQSKSRHRNRGNNVDGGGKNNVLVLDRINQLSIDNTNNNRRPEPMPRQRNNNNNNSNMTNEQPMGSRPNSRQQNHRSSHQQPLKPLSQQQQQRQPNEAFETTRSTIRRQRVQSNSNGDVSDLIGGNDANGDNEMFSYVIDHFKPPNNNNFENDVFGDERFEVESVRDNNETPVPKPRKFMQQSQQTPLVPSKISLRYELADSSGQNNTADAINLRMRRSTNNRPITPRTGPFTSSRQINFSYAGSSNIHQSNTSLDRENGDIINEMLMNRNPSSSSYLFNNNSNNNTNNNNNTNTSNNNNNKMKSGGNNLESKRIELTQQYIKFQTQMSPIITKKASTSIEDSQTDFYDNSQSMLRFDNNN